MPLKSPTTKAMPVLDLLNAQKANESQKSRAEVKKTNEGKAQDDSGYIPVQREWTKGNEVQQMMVQKVESEQMNDGSRFMLQRWQQERTLDQPYHNLEGVKEHGDHANAHQISIYSEHGSSIENFER